MVALEEISRIGFGAYRVGNEPTHAAVLRKAIEAGCNVIDTASTYVGGASEALVGSVLGQGEASRVFIMTKAGYASGISLQSLRELQNRGLAQEYCMRHADDFYYSLSPDFLLCQLEVSRRRLGVKCLDAFLLHNPEHLLALYSRGGEFYSTLGRIFGFLEELIDEGLIRSYGISSNRFAVSGESFAIDLRSVLNAAAISGCHRMRVLQMPFNLMEQSALHINSDGESVLGMARTAQLKVFSNRPFNAMSHNGFIRLATYDGEDAPSEQVARCFTIVREGLALHGACEGGEDILAGMPALAYLFDSWQAVDNSDALQTLFEQHVAPEVRLAFRHGIPEAVARAISELYRLCDMRCRVNMAASARAMLEGTYGELFEKPCGLQVAACRRYLDCGIDCVLVGMRREEYVRDMECLLS